MYKDITIYNLKTISMFIFSIMFTCIIFKLSFGLYSPIVIVQSESMLPIHHIGDIVFIANNNSIFEKDIIVYYQYGNFNTIPIIHRNISIIYKGETMWEYGPISSHSGYITKGDNIHTNRLSDQQSLICSVPVKKEWILGKEIFSIPYLGIFKILIKKILYLII